MDSRIGSRNLSFVHRCLYRSGNESTRPLQLLRSKKAVLLNDLQQADDVQKFVVARKLPQYFIVLERWLQKEVSSSGVTEIVHCIKLINSGLSNHISALWSIRESNTNNKLTLTQSKYLMAGLVRRDIDHVLSLYKRFLLTITASSGSALSAQCRGATVSLSKSSISLYQQSQVLYLLKSSIDLIIPSLLVRLDNFVVQTVRETTTESMRQYCTQHPRDFLVLQRTHSIVLHTLLRACGMESTHTKRSVHSELVIYTLLRQHSMDPLYKSISLALNNPQLVQHYTALGINSTLRFFLEYLIVHNERFDEPGVYQLFRTVLKLQEYVSEIKKELSLNSVEKFVVDTSIWKKAECIVQVLNSAVFSVKQNQNKRVVLINNGSSNASSAQPDLSTVTTCGNNEQYLTEQEKAAWRGLVGGGNKNRLGPNVLSFRRQRHNGTVFVTLELDLKNF